MRETLFNWLMPYVPGAAIVDLFSGSGALGLEALSRGATSAQFIELNKAAADAIQHNLKLLEASSSKVHQQTAQEYLRTVEPQSADIIFLDPPFEQQLHNAIIELIATQKLLRDGALIYIEKPQNQVLQVASDWQLLKQKSSGQVDFLLFQA